jgi:hypothetical protein
MALWTLGLLIAEDQGFELVMAFLADVFKDRHGFSGFVEFFSARTIPLESICGNFAILVCSWWGFQIRRACDRYAVSAVALVAGRACADHCQLFAAAQNSPARARRTND